MKLAIFFLSSFSCLAAITGVTVNPTHNLAIFSYTAATSAACTIEVSKESDYTPLVHDINGTLFTGANSDNGGNLIRVVVVGKASVAIAADGNIYSRALETNTQYFYRISTCNTDTATGTFRTRNLPLGMTFVPNQQINGTTGKWLQPTISYTDRAQEIVDPITGTLLKRIIMPRDIISEDSITALNYNNASSGSGAAWTTPNNVAGAPDATLATYSGTAQDKLVVNLPTPTAFQSVGNGFDFITLKFTGLGSSGTAALRTIQICLSQDATNCISNITDIVLPATSGLVYYNELNTLQDMMGAEIDAERTYYTGLQLLVWKKATSGADTVSIDSVVSYLGRSVRGFATAGGFHDICGIRDSGGWFKCTISRQLVAINSTTGETRNMGIFGIALNNDCFSFGGGSRLFSTTDANQAYCGLSRFTMDSTNTAKAGGVDQLMDFSNVITLLPTGVSLETLLHQFDSTLPANWNCQADAVQNTYIIGACRAEAQDSYAYVWVFGLGNNTSMDDASCGTISNGKCSSSGVGIVAVNAMWRSAVSRYTVFHTLHSQGSTNIIGYESQYASGTHFWGNNPVAVELGNTLNSTQTNVTVSSAWPSTAQSRTGTITTSGTGVSFSGVGFSIEYATTPGDTICAAGQCRTITYLYSASGANIDSAFSPELTGEAWTNQWPTAPSAYTVGEPVSYKYPHWLGITAVGDYFMIGSEAVRIATKISPTSWTVERGCSYFEAACSGTGSAHTAGDNMTPQGIGGSFGEGLMYYWDFVTDPTAVDSNAGNPSNSGLHSVGGIRAPNGFSGSHQTTRGKCLIAAGYDVMCAATGMLDKASWGKAANYPLSVSTGWGFNDKYAQNAGNTFQHHPSNQQMGFCSAYGMSDFECNFFTDYTPFVGGNSWISSGAQSTNIEGNVWKLGAPDGNGNVLTVGDIKSMPILAVNGQKALTNISGPTSNIVTSTTRYEYCFALAAGECRGSGDVGGISGAGDIFFNAPGLTHAYCVGGETYNGTNDVCIGNQTADGNATVQFGLQVPSTTSTIISEAGRRLRTLGKVFAQPRYGSTNAKVLSDGKWIFHPGVHDGSADMWLLKNPGMPLMDSINRNKFMPIKVTIPTMLGADNAYIEFGYHDDNLYCTDRVEKCVAAASNNPFFYASETFSGVTCASGCVVTIPARPSQVLRYNIVYRNSTTIVRRTSIFKVAVN